MVVEARERAGLTQDELAARLKISQSNVSRIESDQVGIDTLGLASLADVLGLDHGLVLRAAAASAEARRQHRSAPDPEPST